MNSFFFLGHFKQEDMDVEELTAVLESPLIPVQQEQAILQSQKGRAIKAEIFK